MFCRMVMSWNNYLCVLFCVLSGVIFVTFVFRRFISMNMLCVYISVLHF